MKLNKGRRVLAIGLDAAEPTLIRRHMETGELPVLKRLLEEGTWSSVASPARIGSGTVWPTFFTGTEPAAHGIHSDWCWQPETMSLMRYDGRKLTPFWKSLADEGMRVGVLDMPFAPLVGLSSGFEINEWGAHDVFEGRMRFAPENLSDILTKQLAPHPFSIEKPGALAEHDFDGLKKFSAGCLEGVGLRGELASRLIRETGTQLSIIIFPEIHHAAHKLWHTLASGNSLYAHGEIEDARQLENALPDILREVDRQIGRLIEAAGDEATVLVFSLHGMRLARGLPAFLAPLLCATAHSHIAGWTAQNWTERALSLFAAIKRRTPSGLKKLYHRGLPQEVTHKLAQPTMIPAYDWRQTRAFALPSDQHGWIRINLAGREAKGCVPLERYSETCREIEEMLRSLATEDGRPLVRDVIRTAQAADDSLSQVIPDMVVHWQDAAFELPMRMNGLLLEAHPAAAAQTGQHAPDGFCIVKGRKARGAQTISAAEIHSIITEALMED
ncbi:MAG TPA: alkaline phosphatase family protein [Pyrinomonadaceae bacterium]|jgi:predicted AlkP superfamily phosphohydrolase/phosphomutase